MLPWLLVNALGLAACLAACVLSWRFPRWRLALAGVALGLLVAKAVFTWLPVEEARLFPWPWYIYLQGYWVAFAGLVFLGLAIPQLPVAWNRLAVAGLAVAVLVLGGWRSSWMVRWHPVGAEMAPGPDRHLIQSTGFTCAPCACAIALGYVGVRATERTMGRACLTVEDEGTTVFNSFRGLTLMLEGTPWRARVAHVTPEDLLRDGQVAVIDFPAIRHAITVVGRGGDVLLHDPLAFDPRPMPRDELARRYGGIAILLEPRR